MKRFVGLSVMVLSALSSAVTTAQANNNEPVDTLKNYQLQGVQVVSTRADNKTPMAFSTLSQQDIKKVNFGPYVLALTPSITTTSDAGNGIGYTSLRVRGTDPSRINITANGIPVSDAESSTTFWVNMADFTSSFRELRALMLRDWESCALISFLKELTVEKVLGS